VQVPTESRVTVLPLTLHTEGVVVLKLTGRPDLAFADTVNGALDGSFGASGPKLMVCG
jgi:hypothetical protein